MASTAPLKLNKADHCYFIWAIVFLIVSGVSLVSYIMITGIYEETQVSDFLRINAHGSASKTPSSKTPNLKR